MVDAGSTPAPEAANSRTRWLTRVDQDGSPHVTAVDALWLDGTFLVQTGSGTRKARNLERAARCSVALSIRHAVDRARGTREVAMAPKWSWTDPQLGTHSA